MKKRRRKRRKTVDERGDVKMMSRVDIRRYRPTRVCSPCMEKDTLTVVVAMKVVVGGKPRWVEAVIVKVRVKVRVLVVLVLVLVLVVGVVMMVAEEEENMWADEAVKKRWTCQK